MNPFPTNSTDTASKVVERCTTHAWLAGYQTLTKGICRPIRWCVVCRMRKPMELNRSQVLVTSVIGSEENTPLHDAHQLLAMPHQLCVHSKLKLTKRERISYVANHTRVQARPHLPATGHCATHKDIDISAVEGLEDNVASEGRSFLCKVTFQPNLPTTSGGHHGRCRWRFCGLRDSACWGPLSMTNLDGRIRHFV